jgi:hypothetical protein
MNGLSVIIPSRNVANLAACVDAIRKHEPQFASSSSTTASTRERLPAYRGTADGSICWQCKHSLAHAAGREAVRIRPQCEPRDQTQLSMTT